MAFQKAVESRRDLQEKMNTRGQWFQAQGERGKFLSVVLDEGRPNEVKAEERGRVQEKVPKPMARGCHFCQAELSLLSSPRFPEPFSQRKPEHRSGKGHSS